MTNGIEAFYQHGFTKTGSITGHIVGDCPFCGEPKMFINEKSHNWDCKKCMREGGFIGFLEQISKHCQDNFRGNVAVALRKKRGLRLSTFREFGVGYNEVTGKYTLPINNVLSGRLQDLRMYSNKLLSTKTCKVGMLGWDKLVEDSDVIWLCEGEWDGMAMWEILSLIDEKATVLAVPGSGTLKTEWLSLFQNKQVRVVYDNDSAGFAGAKKVYKKLGVIVNDIRFVHWPDKYAKGFDLRDLYLKSGDANKTYKTLLSFLRDVPYGLNEEDEEISTKVKVTSFEGEGLAHKEIYNAYRSFLHMPNTDILDVVFGTIIANRLEGDPLWLFVVAPSGGMKSEVLMSLSQCPNIMTTTSLTPHSLVSGANFGGGDPSLIPILNGKILIIKDFTTILNSNAAARDETFGILRDAYDGKTEKRFGNGVFRSYESKFGIIAGVTPAVELFTDNQTALGERFLRFNIDIADSISEREVYLLRALSNTTKETQARQELLSAAKKALSYNFNTDIHISENVARKVVGIAQWTATMRGTINRDKFTKEITHKPFMELGTRLAKQYVKLAMGIAMFKRKEAIDDEELNIIRTMAKSTVPSKQESLIQSIMVNDPEGAYTNGDISEMLSLPTITSQRVAENLAMLGVLKKVKISPMKYEWVLTNEYYDLMERSGIYTI